MPGAAPGAPEKNDNSFEYSMPTVHPPSPLDSPMNSASPLDSPVIVEVTSSVPCPLPSTVLGSPVADSAPAGVEPDSAPGATVDPASSDPPAGVEPASGASVDPSPVPVAVSSGDAAVVASDDSAEGAEVDPPSVSDGSCPVRVDSVEAEGSSTGFSPPDGAPEQEKLSLLLHQAVSNQRRCKEVVISASNILWK